jgi:hypothetical protein
MKIPEDDMTIDERMECFGEFHLSDSVCRKFCSISLRCVMERDEKARAEMLEELVFTDNASMKIQ